MIELKASRLKDIFQNNVDLLALTEVEDLLGEEAHLMQQTIKLSQYRMEFQTVEALHQGIKVLVKHGVVSPYQIHLRKGEPNCCFLNGSINSTAFEQARFEIGNTLTEEVAYITSSEAAAPVGAARPIAEREISSEEILKTYLNQLLPPAWTEWTRITKRGSEFGVEILISFDIITQQLVAKGLNHLVKLTDYAHLDRTCLLISDPENFIQARSVLVRRVKANLEMIEHRRVGESMQMVVSDGTEKQAKIYADRESYALTLARPEKKFIDTELEQLLDDAYHHGDRATVIQRKY